MIAAQSNSGADGLSWRAPARAPLSPVLSASDGDSKWSASHGSLKNVKGLGVQRGRPTAGDAAVSSVGPLSTSFRLSGLVGVGGGGLGGGRLSQRDSLAGIFGRVVHKSGWLYKHPRRRWLGQPRRRWVILEEHILSYHKEDSDGQSRRLRGTIGDATGFIHLADVTRAAPEGERTFVLSTPQRTWTFLAASKRERGRWLRAIAAAQQQLRQEEREDLEAGSCAAWLVVNGKRRFCRAGEAGLACFLVNDQWEAPQESILLEDILAVEERPRKRFRVKLQGRAYVFLCNTEREKKKWVRILSARRKKCCRRLRNGAEEDLRGSEEDGSAAESSVRGSKYSSYGRVDALHVSTLNDASTRPKSFNTAETLTAPSAERLLPFSESFAELKVENVSSVAQAVQSLKDELSIIHVRGWLMKVVGLSCQKRWFVLRNGTLNYYTGNDSWAEPLGSIPLHSVKDVLSEEVGEMKIVGAERTWALRVTRSQEDYSLWLNSLQRVVTLYMLIRESQPDLVAEELALPKLSNTPPSGQSNQNKHLGGEAAAVASTAVVCRPHQNVCQEECKSLDIPPDFEPSLLRGWMFLRRGARKMKRERLWCVLEGCLLFCYSGKDSWAKFMFSIPLHSLHEAAKVEKKYIYLRSISKKQWILEPSNVLHIDIWLLQIRRAARFLKWCWIYSWAQDSRNRQTESNNLNRLESWMLSWSFHKKKEPASSGEQHSMESSIGHGQKRNVGNDDVMKQFLKSLPPPPAVCVRCKLPQVPKNHSKPFIECFCSCVEPASSCGTRKSFGTSPRASSCIENSEQTCFNCGRREQIESAYGLEEFANGPDTFDVDKHNENTGAESEQMTGTVDRAFSYDGNRKLFRTEKKVGFVDDDLSEGSYHIAPPGVPNRTTEDTVPIVCGWLDRKRRLQPRERLWFEIYGDKIECYTGDDRWATLLDVLTLDKHAKVYQVGFGVSDRTEKTRPVACTHRIRSEGCHPCARREALCHSCAKGARTYKEGAQTGAGSNRAGEIVRKNDCSVGRTRYREQSWTERNSTGESGRKGAYSAEGKFVNIETGGLESVSPTALRWAKYATEDSNSTSVEDRGLSTVQQAPMNINKTYHTSTSQSAEKTNHTSNTPNLGVTQDTNTTHNKHTPIPQPNHPVLVKARTASAEAQDPSLVYSSALHSSRPAQEINPTLAIQNKEVSQLSLSKEFMLCRRRKKWKLLADSPEEAFAWIKPLEELGVSVLSR